MKITIFTIGKVKQAFVRDGEKEYLARLQSEHRIEFTELEAQSGKSSSEDEIRAKESKLFLSHLKDTSYLILLDERGKETSSPEFATLLQKKMNSGRSHLIFAIGGAYGWDDKVRSRANHILSLSKLTFTYQMTRLILIEQLYRAFSIQKGLPYHKA